ncbi:MAG: GDP-mannose 4,6-dehydratase [Patescibacteria group bacterium]
MKALVTGIKGFVGRYLEQELIGNNFGVFGITQEPSDTDAYRQGDILDGAFMKKTISALQPDVIFHLAGFTSVKQSWDAPDQAMKVNKGSMEILYDAITSSSPHTKVILTSSAEVYGIPQKSPINENHPTHPASPYGKSKLAQEAVAASHPSVRTIICRSFPHTGPKQQPIFVVPSFAKQIAAIEKGQQENLSVGNLEAKRDFLDVRDVVRAYRLLAESSLWGNTYNVSSGTPYSIKEVLDTLVTLSTSKINVVIDQSRMRPSDIPVLWGDNSKLCHDLSWSPTIPFKQTLEDTLNYWRQNT